jgi:lipoprotein-anchoring transpeptidase ErfK/SrfK
VARIRFLKNIPFSLIALFLLLVAISVFGISAKKSEENVCGCNFTDSFDPNAKTGTFEEKTVIVPSVSLASESLKTLVLGTSTEERWIEISLSEQKVRAWEGNRLFLESLVSTGLPWWPTPTGEFRIWLKTRYTKMEGGSGKYYYYLPNVPYDMFIENANVPGYRGFSLHGTYWHNDFGKVHSHGCVNLPTGVAEKLYYWTAPQMNGKSWVRSSADNPGTRVVIHE